MTTDLSSTPNQLTFSLTNPVIGGTVYVSTDPSANQLNLSISTNAPAELIPGDLVPIDDATAESASLIYLDLTAFDFTEAELAALLVEGNGWKSATYGTPSGDWLVCSPSTAMSFDAASPINLAVKGFTLATMPASPTVQLTAIYFNIEGITGDAVSLADNFAVSAIYPPDQADKNLQMALRVELRPDTVLNCPVDATSPTMNNLELVFYPGQSNEPVIASENTRFTLSFIYAEDIDGFGAMMTVAQATASSFSVTFGQGIFPWAVEAHTSDQTPNWALKPPANQSIFGSGAVSFRMNNLITNFQPGPTIILLSYVNVPGYQDGAFSILAEKFGHVEITDFVPPPQMMVLTGGVAKVKFSWVASYAQRVMLDQYAAIKPTPASACALTQILAPSTDVTGLTSYEVTISESTTFILRAEGQSPDGQYNSYEVPPCTTYIQPTVSFKADPSYIVEGEPNACLLTWKVNAPQSTAVTLSSNLHGQDGIRYDLTGSTTKYPTETETFTMTATPPCGYPIATAHWDVTSMPVITKLVVSGISGDGGKPPHDFTFEWAVIGAPGTKVNFNFSVPVLTIYPWDPPVPKPTTGYALSGKQACYSDKDYTLTITITAIAPTGTATGTLSATATAPH